MSATEARINPPLIGPIPDEIVLRAFTDLGPKGLGDASAVSRRWREFAHDNQVWKRLSSAAGVAAKRDPRGWIALQGERDPAVWERRGLPHTRRWRKFYKHFARHADSAVASVAHAPYEQLRSLLDGAYGGFVTKLDLRGLPGLDDARLAALVELCPNIAQLNLSGQAAVTNLGELPRLRHLDISGTSVASLSAIGRQPDLEVLRAVHTPITDLAPLAGMPKLERLAISPATRGNRLANAGVVEDLRQLRSLRLSLQETPLRLDLSQHEALEVLDLRQSHALSELADLPHAPHLRVVNLDDCWKVPRLHVGDARALERVWLRAANGLKSLTLSGHERPVRLASLRSHTLTRFTGQDGVQGSLPSEDEPPQQLMTHVFTLEPAR